MNSGEQRGPEPDPAQTAPATTEPAPGTARTLKLECGIFEIEDHDTGALVAEREVRA